MSSQPIAHERARRVMPGGVNSPVRAFQAVGREPVTVRRGRGARVYDLADNAYVDYVASYGPLIAGHAPDEVVAAVTEAAAHGTSFGMPTELETELAEEVVDAVPGVDVVRFVNSGTEAMMTAIRLARGATGRPKVVKCVGGYHGHIDGLLVQAGSGAMTLGVPSSPGVPESTTADTLLMPYNDLAAAEALFAEQGDQIAAVSVEPIAGNMGCVPPEPGYLAGLRKLCDDHGALLVFDEVMTGFRVDYGGAQRLYGVTPDITALGKIVGGGLPCAAYGGKESLMRQMAPDGPIYQAGTLSGNPLAMAAGKATLGLLGVDDAYGRLERLAKQFADGLQEAANEAGTPVRINRVGSMLTVFFRDGAVRNDAEAMAADTDAYARFFRSMLDAGVMLPPAQYECWFVSLAHDEDTVDWTVRASRDAFRAA